MQLAILVQMFLNNLDKKRDNRIKYTTLNERRTFYINEHDYNRIVNIPNLQPLQREESFKVALIREAIRNSFHVFDASEALTLDRLYRQLLVMKCTSFLSIINNKLWEVNYKRDVHVVTKSKYWSKAFNMALVQENISTKQDVTREYICMYIIPKVSGEQWQEIN